MRSSLCAFLHLYICYSVLADPCESQDTCSKCITNANCVWCEKVDYEGIRCKSLNSEIQKQCPNDLQNMHSTVTVTHNDDFTSSSKHVVQIAPQNIKLKLRVGEPTNFNFKYKQAENYPVDLYFLLDVSNSMKKIRDTLMKQSQDLYNVMKKFTSIIRLGIGTFVDKNTFPFVNDPQKKEVYSFRNQLPLTDNVTLFNETLKNTKFIQNFDLPEGGLDALGQVLACSNGPENIIGWSPHSRKIVLFITDDQYHAAGDGMIAGIVTPYDGKCYTGADGVYKKELEMDYPSVAVIKKLAKKIGVITIFVAKDSVESIYSDLADAVYGKSEAYSIQENANGKTKFDKILKEVYEEKTKTIRLLTSSTPKTEDFYEITFTPDCKKRDFISNAESENECTVKFYEEKPIIGTITLKKYDESVRNFKIEVIMDGLNEILNLDVEVITKCECEAGIVKKAPQCNNNGALECGLCNCDKNWFGHQCNCTQYYDKEDDFASCKRKGDDKVCSGNGDCICGACICHRSGNEQKYSGKYCHCDIDSCPRRNNSICSNHGRCQCGVCSCDKSWTGLACDVSTLKTNCIKNNKECNERGKCYNNGCVCDVLPEWDERKTNVNSFCIIVPDSGVHNRQCKALEELVLCTYDGKDLCSTIDSLKICRIEKINTNENSSWNICHDVRVGVGCYIHFGYKYYDENRTMELAIAEKANCQQNYYVIGGITFTTLILAGIGTLIGWKVLTTLRDRREYEQFLASNQRKSSIRKNVLYTSPMQTIQNPTFVENTDQTQS